MSDPRYLRPGAPFALAHVVEECGEVLAAAGKCQRWGMDSVNPELPPAEQETNRDWLLRELADLDGAVMRLRREIQPPAAANPLVRGATIPMGDGSYFDYSTPDASAMTIEDYAWGLAGKARFNGQTRTGLDRRRCLFSVCQHVVIIARAMLAEGCTDEQAYEGLMHESDEVVWPDFASPVKPMLPPDLRARVKASGDAIDHRFGNANKHKALVKTYDLRMLATEKRDLILPQGPDRRWSMLEGIEPFDEVIHPLPPEMAVASFLTLHEALAGRLARAAA